jgi:hypothetical protein
MATDYKKLIDINGLATFKQEADKVYETKDTVQAVAARVKALEDDDSAANTIEIVKVNNISLTPDANKAVNIQVPTRVAELMDASSYATESYVTTAISNANHLQATEVATLPAAGQTNILYLVPDDGGKSNKDMYIWDATNNAFVLIGNTEVDLTDYTTESQFSVATAAQVQALFE